MKYVLSIAALFMLLSFHLVDSIYDITLKTINGKKIELSQYKGKKLLFILLPLSVQDTTVSIRDIARLQAKYQKSLVVIGIASEEAGYKTQDADKLKTIYMHAAPNIIITEGMKVKKGTGQSSLLRWLTSKDQNHHFDQDARGVGTKFFVDEQGELYAVMGPKLALTNPLMDRILARPLEASNNENRN
jgi:glutathione peroxidase